MKDNFGNVHRIGVLGISRAMAAEEQRTQPVNPLDAVWLGAQETWFVVDRTISYLGGIVAGPGSGRSARRADPDRAGVGAGRDGRPGGVAASCGGAFGLDRPS